MKLYLNIILLLILIFYISSCSNIQKTSLQDEFNSIAVIKKVIKKTPAKRSIINIDSNASFISNIDNIFNLYTSKKLGISIKVPKKVSISYCKKRKEKKYSYIKVFEDNNSIYIAPIITYDWKTCDVISTNLKDLQANKVFGVWKITPKIINSINENLSSIGKKLYNNENCEIKELKDTNKGDLKNVIMNTTLPETKDGKTCYLNYASTFKYSPSKNKYIGFLRGQDYGFRLDNNILDKEILNSFQFLD